MGFWIPELLLGFFSPLPVMACTDTIFFFEALCVCAALHWAVSNISLEPRRLIIYTDNTNTVNIFSSLHASPAYNPILMSAVNVLMDNDIDLRVPHINGIQNTVADAISRQKFYFARKAAPGLNIGIFSPPRDALGAVKL
ncbi:hypothetical protein JAAARDRAFT_133104 [Jaapia argillacea MUCL 33604]|uniref:RNase H type-1 domain-containing protein n=1 Tax=Jaapia argillacea MUCL 33604 TaxID=933084 RepID=A0A067PQC7_9AGAM|nr:hypothetical protein JAAARDRAFT_133104 [Jaapia argillacea MUCL 33604]